MTKFVFMNSISYEKCHMFCMGIEKFNFSFNGSMTSCLLNGLSPQPIQFKNNVLPSSFFNLLLWKGSIWKLKFMWPFVFFLHITPLLYWSGKEDVVCPKQVLDPHGRVKQLEHDSDKTLDMIKGHFTSTRQGRGVLTHSKRHSCPLRTRSLSHLIWGMAYFLVTT